MICAGCGAAIMETERTIQTFRGVMCELCAEQIERCTPDNDDVVVGWEYPQP